MEKILFPVEETSLNGGNPELLWAKGCGDGFFEVWNSPFYAKGVSFLDIVETAVDPHGVIVFVSNARPSGHSTYRILSDTEIEEILEWRLLSQLGCTYESGRHQDQYIYAVDVPPAADIYAVYNILQMAERDEVWVFDEGHCGHLLSKPN